jgi:hypothetical protein
MTDTSPTIDHYLAQEQAKETARELAWRAESERYSGVSWSGMGPAPYVPRSPAEVLNAAREREAQMSAFCKSPRGRLVQAIRELDAIGYCIEADQLYGIYSRSLANSEAPLDTEAVGAAIVVANKLPRSAARECVDALAELLLGKRRAA